MKTDAHSAAGNTPPHSTSLSMSRLSPERLSGKGAWRLETLVLVLGPSGSGKSTFIKSLEVSSTAQKVCHIKKIPRAALRPNQAVLFESCDVGNCFYVGEIDSFGLVGMRFATFVSRRELLEDRVMSQLGLTEIKQQFRNVEVISFNRKLEEVASFFWRRRSEARLPELSNSNPNALPFQSNEPKQVRRSRKIRRLLFYSFLYPRNYSVIPERFQRKAFSKINNLIVSTVLESLYEPSIPEEVRLTEYVSLYFIGDSGLVQRELVQLPYGS
jgi:energy-coupling factor transporter ATP-binding protein EcfA2